MPKDGGRHGTAMLQPPSVVKTLRVLEVLRSPEAMATRVCVPAKAPLKKAPGLPAPAVDTAEIWLPIDSPHHVAPRPSLRRWSPRVR